MTIQDLIAEKRRQIGLLERHIKMLVQMAMEEGRNSGAAPKQLRPAQARRQHGARRRGRTSRAAMAEAYLRAHPDPQPAREIAAALGLKPPQLHGAIHSGLKTGRFVRGKQRATFGLGTGGGEAAQSPKARRAKGTRGRRRKARTTKTPTTRPSA